jgi:hypothetical protein
MVRIQSIVKDMIFSMIGELTTAYHIIQFIPGLAYPPDEWTPRHPR